MLLQQNRKQNALPAQLVIALYAAVTAAASKR
jgi:hypothetical protein